VSGTGILSFKGAFMPASGSLMARPTIDSKSAQSNLLGYQLGMRINVDVLNAQNTYAQAQYNLAQAQYNTILGNVNLKAAIGELGDEDVGYINALLSTNQSKN
jgi:outer membrane protein